MSFLRSRQGQRALLIVALLALAGLMVSIASRGGGTTPSVLPSGAATGVGPSAGTAAPIDPVSGLPWINESELPAEARRTLVLIAAGGPFPYPRNDNQPFANREGLLPGHPRGYYREFTVITPGSPDRGPRRIITGAGGERYWTADHYRSFARIREAP